MPRVDYRAVIESMPDAQDEASDQLADLLNFGTPTGSIIYLNDPDSDDPVQQALHALWIVCPDSATRLIALGAAFNKAGGRLLRIESLVYRSPFGAVECTSLCWERVASEPG